MSHKLDSNPLVSVFLPYYNDEKYLAQSIQSVLSQSYKNFELLLLNHASTDKSEKIAHSFSDPRIINLSMEENILAGGSDVFFKLFRAAQGQYLKFFSADDLLLSDCLATQVTYLENNSNKGFCAVKAQFIDAHNTVINQEFQFLEHDRRKLLLAMFHGKQGFLYPTVMAKKDCITESMFDGVMGQCFDTALWISLTLKTDFGLIDNQLLQYRIHEAQLSGKKAEKHNPLIKNRLSFEQQYIHEYFCKFCDTSMIKYIFDIEIPKKLIPCFLAIKLLMCCPQYTNFSLNKLYYEFQDEEIRAMAKKSLGFGIKDFRIAISHYNALRNYALKDILSYLVKTIIKKLLKRLSSKKFQNI